MTSASRAGGHSFGAGCNGPRMTVEAELWTNEKAPYWFPSRGSFANACGHVSGHGDALVSWACLRCKPLILLVQMVGRVGFEPTMSFRRRIMSPLPATSTASGPRKRPGLEGRVHSLIGRHTTRKRSLRNRFADAKQPGDPSIATSFSTNTGADQFPSRNDFSLSDRLG